MSAILHFCWMRRVSCVYWMYLLRMLMMQKLEETLVECDKLYIQKMSD